MRNFTNGETRQEVAEDVLEIVIVVGTAEDWKFGRPPIINMVYAVLTKFDLGHYGEVYETSRGESRWLGDIISKLCRLRQKI